MLYKVKDTIVLRNQKNVITKIDNIYIHTKFMKTERVFYREKIERFIRNGDVKIIPFVEPVKLDKKKESNEG